MVIDWVGDHFLYLCASPFFLLTAEARCSPANALYPCAGADTFWAIIFVIACLCGMPDEWQSNTTSELSTISQS